MSICTSNKHLSGAGPWIAALVGLLLAGCGDDPAAAAGTAGVIDTASDVSVVDTPTPLGEVVIVDLGPTPGETGTATDVDDDDVAPEVFVPCTGPEDCESELCVLTRDGQKCTTTCITECPDGFACQLLSTGDTDAKTVCVPQALSLCFPCVTDADCATVPGAATTFGGARCLLDDNGEGSCGAECTNDSDCPGGFSCESLTEGEETFTQCVPDDGACECTTLAVQSGASAPCSATGDAGVCAGARTCNELGPAICDAAVPADETCNGLDDDCDGTADEELAPVAALKQGGVCLGAMQSCAGGDGWLEPEYSNIAAWEAIETQCDGKDNDCDGNADNTLDPPPAAKQEGVCAGSLKLCAGANGWLEPAFGGIAGYEFQETQCDGLDNDCDGLTDEDLDAPLADNQAGVCADAVKTCGGTAGWLEPDYATVSNYEADETQCDELDNDCDQATDEAFGAGGTVTFSLVGGGEAVKGDVCGVGTCTGGTVICGSDKLTLACSTSGDAGFDVCDGQDNDCNPATLDGQGDPAVGIVCDGDDSDLCKLGTTSCEGGNVVCIETGPALVEVCDGQDNDCNPATPDGNADPGLNAACDGADEDLCEEGLTVCSPEGLVCSDANDPDPEICDNLDNDCNPATPDGSADPNVGKPCDGIDADLCSEGLRVCQGGTLECDDPNEANPELCDGLDNDCNPDTVDGVGDPQLGTACDGVDADLCDEGLKFCTAGALACNDPNDVDSETCDGQDNDCNPATPDGSADPQLGTTCDGADTDLCKEGTRSCGGGVLVCDEAADNALDICDGQDNDCNPATPDGANDPLLDAPCDGIDADLCTEGNQICVLGSLQCDDTNDADPDVCDGEDNDCNGATPDGSGDGTVGQPCDGTDADLCLQGQTVCQTAQVVCNDPNDANPDVCDGQDNDCNPSTPDGIHDPQNGDACDGADADWCAEGQLLCTSGGLICNDLNDLNPELCDGLDNDCNPTTVDGQDEAALGDACDGTDVDLCNEGQTICSNGALACNDPNDADPEVCDNTDNDCNPLTADGSGDPQLGDPCDGTDSDLCKEGVFFCSGSLQCDDINDVDLDGCDGVDNDCDPATADGSLAPSIWGANCATAATVGSQSVTLGSTVVVSGGFNRTSPQDYVRFEFQSTGYNQAFSRSLTLTGNGYRMEVLSACGTTYDQCTSGSANASAITAWSVDFNYLAGPNASDDDSRPVIVTARVFRQTITETCEPWTITATNSSP
ncbi:MAG: hypothetical protein ACI9WU_001368 [Myxococcota bacterium]|jgi:hypothetical protein